MIKSARRIGISTDNRIRIERALKNMCLLTAVVLPLFLLNPRMNEELCVPAKANKMA